MMGCSGHEPTGGARKQQEMDGECSRWGEVELAVRKQSSLSLGSREGLQAVRKPPRRRREVGRDPYGVCGDGKCCRRFSVWAQEVGTGTEPFCVVSVGICSSPLTACFADPTGVGRSTTVPAPPLFRCPSRSIFGEQRRSEASAARAEPDKIRDGVTEGGWESGDCNSRRTWGEHPRGAWGVLPACHARPKPRG
jgi:hypothetical protein